MDNKLTIRCLICGIGRLFFGWRRRVKPHTEAVERILVLRTGAIGDVIMSSGFMNLMRKNYPDATITCLVANWCEGVVAGDPCVDRVVVYDDKMFFEFRWKTILPLIRQIRREKHQLLFVLGKAYHWSILGMLFGIPCRVGFDRYGEGFAHHYTVKYDGTKYEGEYYIDLLRALGWTCGEQQSTLYISEINWKRAKNFFNQNVNHRPVLAIAPGGAKNPGQIAEIKRWPIEYYIRLIQKISNMATILILGGKGDIDLVATIKMHCQNAHIVDVCGQLTIQESSALLRQCDCVLMHDSGPLHMAAAVRRTGMIALFGPTDPRRFAPPQAKVLKSPNTRCPCHNVYGQFVDSPDEPMSDVPVDLVYDEVMKVFELSIAKSGRMNCAV